MQKLMKSLPGVDKLLNLEEIEKLVLVYGREAVVRIIREVLETERKRVLESGIPADQEEIISAVILRMRETCLSTLKPVINATGIVLHTNLGRAPLGKKVLEDISPVIMGYSNLEFDLETGKRGHRNSHIKELIKTVTNADDAVVVNNNAAAMVLSLKTLAEGKEVIVSRGELVEIGGAFRIPDILDTSGAKMVEVGTTNRTRIRDYENAITDNTKILLKTHQSNYFIGGFTEEASLEELSGLAMKYNLILLYDIGSGLLRKPDNLPLKDEPDVKSSLAAGADLVCFSGDKLLGGPQAGIIVGKSEFVSQIAKAPLMRALRVDKLTIAALASVMTSYLQDETLMQNLPIFAMLSRTKDELRRLARKLSKAIRKMGLVTEITESEAQCGGGTLPHLRIKSFAVKINFSENPDKNYAQKIFYSLLKIDTPILGILREGNLCFDVLSIFEEDINYIAETVSRIKAL